MAAEDKCYLGFDLSTQQLKVTAIDDELKVISEFKMSFDEDLSEFGTSGGAEIQSDKLTVTAPVLMWVKAFDLVLEKMKNSKFDFTKVQSLSGSAQQHGSVYWKDGASDTMKNMPANRYLHYILESSFSVKDSPIWMDSSTSSECQNLEKAIGGPERLAEITGSRAYERFTGNQIAKIYKKYPQQYKDTERISLVSSFLATLFLGSYAAIDYSDGSGMNLLDIRRHVWSEKCLDACAPGLKEKLGNPMPSHAVLGTISPYLIERYGFNPDCKIVAFTGDNAGSMAGLRIEEGDIVVSLGTSDTVFFSVKDPKPAVDGHIFCNPVDCESYMALVCFKNGSLTRERIRDECANGSWDEFSKALKETTPGNSGYIGFYYDVLEITPAAIGIHRFAPENCKLHEFPKEVEIRALIEGQFMSKRLYAEALGFKLRKESKVLATGGASVNLDILQVLSDVFNSPVYTIKTSDSACLGSAFRAKQGPTGKAFRDVIKTGPEPKLVVRPSPESEKAYCVSRFQMLEHSIMHSCDMPE